MAISDLQILFDIQHKLVSNVPFKFQRSLFKQINWKNNLIEIFGARGVGKTTLLLQKVKELMADEKALYVSADYPYFFNKTLYDLAKDWESYGGKYLFIDEIHRYPPKQSQYDWSAEIKYIYDTFPGLTIVYSGSSVIELYKGQGDLSRRKSAYHLNGLSFREYLELTGVMEYPVLTLEEILSNHLLHTQKITSKIKILPHFDTYIKQGYYPFFTSIGNPEEYYFRLMQIINTIIENDLISVLDIHYETGVKLKKLLGVVASSPPYTSKIKYISEALRIKDYRRTLKLIDYLEKAELVLQLKQQAKGNKILQKPEKIYLNNSNLMYALEMASIKTGTVRETFFLNQLTEKHRVLFPKNVDFLVDDIYFFEVGGKNKKRKSYKDISGLHIVSDNMENGFEQRIPLWIFGFLY